MRWCFREKKGVVIYSTPWTLGPSIAIAEHPVRNPMLCARRRCRCLFCRVRQSVLYRLVHPFYEPEFHVLFHRLGYFFQILFIHLWKHYALDPRPSCSEDLLLYPTNGQYKATQCDLTRHGHVVSHGFISKQRDQRHHHRYARG